MNPADIRIEKGRATPEELAALTVLLVRTPRVPPRAPAVRTPWPADSYDPPHSWRGTFSGPATA
ncbi:acyl-CoA carboxylase subunit epsilon [Streptomyces sp. MUM 203J]|uniref:acyl-CoA carboxylase epsilon subunit n=1 Tax=Streptomyces sp. MUM 203J TaxID=2791990 RepID=UPI001F04D154|nr:acyl-CoA carboxylase epsilon subunit [Streptomyces sp. MUM 203J]MCH0542699.1 acyl-CoA carboxylase subunit epsilon [Streptomyces sp. MUM 203J]